MVVASIIVTRQHGTNGDCSKPEKCMTIVELLETRTYPDGVHWPFVITGSGRTIWRGSRGQW